MEYAAVENAWLLWRKM